MKNLNAKVLAIGALAGFTAALLVYGATVQPLLFILFGALSALPILIVGLGWGNITVITAVVTAGIVGAVGQSPSFGLFAVLMALVPAWLSHLANLARPASELGGPEHLTAWYPLSDIMLHLCGLAAAVIVIVGAIMGYNADLVGQLVDAYVSVMNQQPQPELQLNPAVIDKTKSLMLYAIPLVWGMIWVMMLLAAYYMAIRIVAASSRNLRPREDIPSALRMNRNAIFVFLAAVVAMFFGGIPALIGAATLGAFGAGFIVSGFASLHYRTRGKDWRIPVLILCYLTSLMLTVPLFIILVLGLYDTRKAIALTPNKNAEIPKQPDTKI
ncbi:DUF2232 domain-containing protein [Rhizobium rhizogenes]|uniref:DUF2232 domain-containing protein n=1 Tax=Rhizobium rhizogenes TaxID=359 RepID=UPI00157362E4|nr:DUF2232 domain-containing protein [Rhizobium rhizogenes]NTH18052.1 DUF2232 domain-containing protein [Rhizobium rhizogenes]NTH31024.1 DUF2232 domain-containing protein [Rhizobium rhizogenes]